LPEPLLTYRGAVYPWHCDHVGHMNVKWYVGKFDEATWQFFNALVARTTLKGVYLDTVARKSCAFPDSIATKAVSMLGPE
jgi:acyl-CoA thioesterase FadM